eukprot:gnl/TRDRNA2_/TRDRNA2_158448_c1_seq1.p1 gnl/TRDRNA2_/TRDRNA2_158448_c1~~gnl/TRDRNA2_/TRDRNA2_158448_c1_seq1.p1  ORF type:complete len:200 (+),score=43.81 gnl/TRDRNA2_/TRDRNA2_158448_c1_seq1:35-634(+)
MFRQGSMLSTETGKNYKAKKAERPACDEKCDALLSTESAVEAAKEPKLHESSLMRLDQEIKMEIARLRRLLNEELSRSVAKFDGALNSVCETAASQVSPIDSRRNLVDLAVPPPPQVLAPPTAFAQGSDTLTGNVDKSRWSLQTEVVLSPEQMETMWDSIEASVAVSRQMQGMPALRESGPALQKRGTASSSIASKTMR